MEVRIQVAFSRESSSAVSFSMNDILKRCGPDFERIEMAMNRHFSSNVPFVNEISEYILFAGGKRFRPLLTVYAARMCGRDDEAVYDLSVVPEYLHAASLLHDDVVDEGTLRRGKPPAYHVWGNKAAVLAGDFLYARAIDLASSFGDVRIARTIAETVSFMAEGEIIQLLHSKIEGFDESLYEDVIYRKTGVLIAASCSIGALLAGANENQVDDLSDYGILLGKAFQVVDDVLDYTADAEEFGKALGTDLAEGKLTLPLVVGMDRASASQREKLHGILGARRPSKRDFAWVAGLLETTGSLEYCKNKAEELIGRAISKLQSFEPSETRQILEGLARYVLIRRK